MLLVWNIVLLSIAIFYLFRIVQHPLNAQDLAAECANAITTSQSTGL